MPQNSEELIKVYKKVVDPKLPNWVVFENGTCVIIYHPPKDLEAEAKEVSQKYGTVTTGSESADFTVTKVDNGWIVSEEEGYGKEDYEIGLLGRNEKEQDSDDNFIPFF